MLKPMLGKLVAGEHLTAEQMSTAFELIMTGQAEPAQVGALLSLIQLRGASVDEIIGAATVMRSKVTPVTVPEGLTAVDTCGTGGDGSGTFNVSTSAAIVAAAAGRPHGMTVAKHGNKAVTSRSGSSQVLEALGVALSVSGATLTRCLDEAGLCFCFAPAHHPAMKHAGPIRAQLGFRTIFNLLGPLTNPAGAKRQVMGVFDPGLTEPIAEALLRLGAEAAMVVCGYLGDVLIDELSIGGVTRVSEVRDGRVITDEYNPSDLNLAPLKLDELMVKGPYESAEVVRQVLQGEPGSCREIVCLNAAAALVVGGVASDLADGFQRSVEAIDSGAAKASLEKLVELTQADAVPA